MSCHTPSPPQPQTDTASLRSVPVTDHHALVGQPPPHRPRIVVAEDEALIRMDLVEMLQEVGYDVVAAVRDGRSAIDQVRVHHPDLVVMDVKMPVLDGISAAEVIGSEGLAPVVMLTAFSDKDLVDRAGDAGVMGYVVKPFTLDDLRPAIVVALSRWAERAALAEEIADLSQRLETRKRLDTAKGILMRQLAIDEPAAFRWIQKAAMDRRLGMRDVADAIIAGAAPTALGKPPESAF